MTPPQRREAWELVGGQLDDILHRLDIKDRPKTWIATWGPAILAVTVAIVTSMIVSYSAQQVLIWRMSAAEVDLEKLRNDVDAHRQNWRAHKIRPDEGGN